MRHLFYWFFIITAIPIYYPIFRTKLYYEDRTVQGRRIPKGTIVVSNHGSIYDYASFLFATVPRFSRTMVAEVLYGKNKALDTILSLIGAIKVDREGHSTNALGQAIDELKRGHTLYINPEGRLPKEGETDINPFNPGFVLMAMRTGAKVIPVYTNSECFSKKRVRMMVGKPIDLKTLYNDKLGMRENLDEISRKIRDKVKELGELLEARR